MKENVGPAVDLRVWDLWWLSFKFPRIVPTQRSEEKEGYMPLIENILKVNCSMRECDMWEAVSVLLCWLLSCVKSEQIWLRIEIAVVSIHCTGYNLVRSSFILIMSAIMCPTSDTTLKLITTLGLQWMFLGLECWQDTRYWQAHDKWHVMTNWPIICWHQIIASSPLLPPPALHNNITTRQSLSLPSSDTIVKQCNSRY